MQSGKSG